MYISKKKWSIGLRIDTIIRCDSETELYCEVKEIVVGLLFFEVVFEVESEPVEFEEMWG